MKNALLFAVLLSSTAALADIVPDHVAVCNGKSAGAKCTTDDGTEGICQETLVSRPDYGSGVPPTYKQVKMLGCVAPAKGSARSMLPWMGFGLGFFALLLAMWSRRGGNGGAPATA